VAERVYANNDFSGQAMSGGGYYGENPYGAALQPVPEVGSEHELGAESQVESQAGSQAESQAGAAPGEHVDPGTLMSFLTDFRTAQYEEVRRQRMEALEKSRKGRGHRPVPPIDPVESVEPVEPVEEAGAEVEGPYEGGYEGAEFSPEPEWAPPTVEYPVEGQPQARDAEDNEGFQVAACKPEEPAGKKRFRLGLPSFKNLGQSPATA
jgi:hypothetical protein